MRKLFMQSTILGVLLLASSLTTTSAQQTPWRVVQGIDGTLYLVTGNTRYALSPDQISDDDLSALADGGTLGSELPMPPTPAPVVVRIPAPPQSQPATATPVPATSTPVPPEQPVTVTGRNSESSKLLTLRGGSYTVTWSVMSSSKFNGNHFTGLFTSVNTPNNALLDFGGPVDAGKTASGQTNLYSLPRGQYFITGLPSGSDVDVTWTVTVTPQ